MEQSNPLHELSYCIERHNKASRAARELWAEAEQEGRRIGHLVGALLAEGTPAAEVGRLLVAVDDTHEAPPGLTAVSSGAQDQPESAARPAACESTSAVKDKNERTTDRVPPQAEHVVRPPAKESCDRTRALEVVRSVRWPSGLTVGTLMRALAAEGRTITEVQTQSWLQEWSAVGEVILIGTGRYLHSAQAALSPTLATGEHAPLLLRRAFQLVSGAPKKEMATHP
ncbi:hypothetical protein [Streptomyces sp. NPDC058291]|uniref:hypothetical protein n=1 Tax=Streptomyces sp. NPDC058291 TaxID=3346427 RepID=UPI0036E6B8A1